MIGAIQGSLDRRSQKGVQSMLIEMKVKNLAFDLSKSGAMVFLEEMEGKRTLPIWIGIFEANADRKSVV